MADETLRVYWHDDCMLHDGGPSVLENEPPECILFPEPHVETAMRVRNIKGVLENGPLKDRIDLRTGRHATDEEILTFHTQDHLAAMKAAAANPEAPKIHGRNSAAGARTVLDAGAGCGAFRTLLMIASQRASSLLGGGEWSCNSMVRT